MIIDPAKMDSDNFYKILIGSILPRPIAWVSTISNAGVANLAPFSFFTVASANPPVLCFAPALTTAMVNGEEVPVPKDTLRNILETGQFVVNIVSKELAEKMVASAGQYPPDVSEFDMVGLTQAKSNMVRAPRVAESLINFECKLRQVLEFGQHDGAGRLVLGDVLCANLDESVYKNGHVDMDVLQPIGRLGGNFYSTITDRFRLARPEV